MRSFLLSGALLVLSSVARGQSAPASYKDQAGNSHPVEMMTSVTASGAVPATSYKTSAGTWRPLPIVAMICSVDANGAPQLCSSSSGGLTQTQADARYLQLSGGTMTGPIMEASSTFANLPSSPATWSHMICTDCYSTLRTSGNTATGIDATYNGTNWVDGNGNPVLH